MSFQSAARALRTRCGKPSLKLVLIGIAEHDGDGGSWPSIETLAAYAEVSERQAKRLVRELVRMRLIDVEYNGGGDHRTPVDRRPNRYDIIGRVVTDARGRSWFEPAPDDDDDDGPRDDTDDTPDDGPRDDTDDTRGGTSTTERDDIDDTHGMTSTSPEPAPSTDPEPVREKSAFDRFWLAYPHKVGRLDAEQAFADMVDATAVTTVMANLQQWVDYWQAMRTETRFIPHPTTWLRKRRFDEHPPMPTDGSTDMSTAAKLRRIETIMRERDCTREEAQRIIGWGTA